VLILMWALNRRGETYVRLDLPVRHCWVNCVSTRTHNFNTAVASTASLFKEAGDLARGGDLDDSTKDMQANGYGQRFAFLPHWCATRCANVPTRR